MYAAIKVSVTVGHDDVARARDGARVINRATGTPPEAVVIGKRADEWAAGMVAAAEAMLITYSAD